MSTERTISLSALANLANLTPRRIQQMAKEGVVIRADRATFQFVPSIQGMFKFYQDRVGGSAPVGEELQNERVRLCAAQADHEEMRVKQLAGELIPRDVVIATWQALVAACRAKLLSLPTKAAHVALAAQSLPELDEALRKQVHEALEELEHTGLPKGFEDRFFPSHAGMGAAADPDGERVGGSISKTESGGERGTRPMAN